MADVSGSLARMDDHRGPRDLTPGEHLQAAIAQLAARADLDLEEGLWQLVAHLQHGHIRKVELLPVTSSVRVTVGSHALFEAGPC